MEYKKNLVMTFQRADGPTLIAGTDYPDYKILNAEGLTGLGYEFTTATHPQIAGEKLINSRAEARHIDIEFAAASMQRERAIAFFSPNHLMTLVVEWNGVKRWIAGYVKPVRIATRNIYDRLTLKIEVFCPDPYWRDMSNFGKDITFRQAMLSFPFAIPARGLVSSYRVAQSSIVVCNDGDVKAPIRALFQAHGDLVRPKLILNESEFIQVDVQMKRGDALDINTDPRGIYVKLNGESVLNKSDRLSSFFQLPVGESLISYDVGQGFDAVSVIVYYTPRYLGV